MIIHLFFWHISKADLTKFFTIKTTTATDIKWGHTPKYSREKLKFTVQIKQKQV